VRVSVSAPGKLTCPKVTAFVNQVDDSAREDSFNDSRNSHLSALDMEAHLKIQVAASSARLLEQ